MALNHCKVIFVLGPPCSGKTTLCSALAATGGWTHVKIDEGLDEGAAEKQLGAAIKAGDRLLVSGFPSGHDLLDDFNTRWPQLTVLMTFLLEAPYDVLRSRHESRRTDGVKASFDLRYKHFVQDTEKVVERFRGMGLLRLIDATVPTDWALAEARAHLEPTVFFLTGPPGCGKSVLCKRLAEKLNEGSANTLVHCIGVGDLIRRHDHLLSYVEDGDLVPSKVVMNLISQEMSALGSEGKVLLLDGFPRCAENLQVWTDFKNGPAVAMTLHITCPQELCQQRVSSRGRSDDGIFKKRYKLYENETLPVLTQMKNKCSESTIDFEVLDIDGKTPISDLVDQTIGAVRAYLPFSVSVGHRAVTFLRTWIDAAGKCSWAELDAGTTGNYGHFLRECMLTPTKAPSPSADVWLCWVTHLLRTEDFKRHAASFCKAASIARPPSINAAAVDVEPSAELHALASLVPRTARAFVEALGMLDFAGLRPLSNPLAWTHAGECLEKLLSLLTNHYRKFLHKSEISWKKGERLAPPMELDWLWHAHILHGNAYADDCLRLQGQVIPHRPEESGEAEVAKSALCDDLISHLRHDLARFAEQHHTSLEWIQELHRAEQHTHSNDSGVQLLASLLPIGESQAREKLQQAGGDVGAALAAAVLVSESPMTTTTSIAVEVLMVSGDIVFNGNLNPDSTVKDLRLLLSDLALIPKGTEPSFARAGPAIGATLSEAEQLYCGSSDVSITMVLGAAKEPELSGWTCPRCGQENAVRGPGYPCADCYGPNGRTNNAMCSRCSCFTSDCEFTVVKDQVSSIRSMSDLQVGDYVLTGRKEYRRVTRIWLTPVDGLTATVQLTPGCRLTCGHPVLTGSGWQRPEDISSPSITYEDNVYTIEIEGHNDTLSVGGMTCAAIGVYCGEDFGWNIFTRKTVSCDLKGCKLCKLIVDESIDFATVVPTDLLVRYKPHFQEDSRLHPSGSSIISLSEQLDESHLITA